MRRKERVIEREKERERVCVCETKLERHAGTASGLTPSLEGQQIGPINMGAWESRDDSL